MANQRITQLTAMTATPANNDLLVLVDVSDTTMAASGTNKKITSAYFANTNGVDALIVGGGTVTLGGNTFTVGKTGAAACEDTTNGFLLAQTFHGPIIWDRDDATIAGGTVTVTSPFMRIDTEGTAATDDLTTIVAGVTTGQVVVLQTNASTRDVVVKHGAGNIYLNGAADFTLSTLRDKLMLIAVASEWHEIGRGDNA